MKGQSEALVSSAGSPIAPSATERMGMEQPTLHGNRPVWAF